MYHKKSEKGQALILIVFAVIGLLGLTALAVDGGYAYADRRQAQNAADSAALAAAQARIRGGDITNAALGMTSVNGYDDGSVFISVNSPPVEYIDSNNDGENDCDSVDDNDGYGGGDDHHVDGGDDDDDNDGEKNSDDDDDDNDGIDDEHDDDDDNDGIDDEDDDHDNDNDNDGEENDEDDDDDNDGIDDEHDNDDDNDGIDDDHDDDDDVEDDHDNDGVDDEHDDDDDNDGVDDEHDNDDDDDGEEEPSREQCESNQYAGDPAYIQVIITSYVDTYFAQVVGINRTINVVQAIARAKPAEVQPMAFGNAIVALKPSGTSTFWMHGNPSMTTIGGGVFVNSSTNCGFTSNGVPDLTTPNITMVAGQSCPQMAGVGVTYNAPQMTYPPDNLPNPVCSGNAVKNGNTLSPGTVNGSFPPSGVTVLNPGVYCVNGSFSLNGNDTLTGNEVVIVMNSGNIRWNGNGALHLTAPTSGPFKGLLIYFPMSNSSEIRINGTNDQVLTGTILAPASPVVLLGTANTDAFNSQIIGYTVEIDGTFDGTVRYNDNQNYDATVPPQIELTR